MSDHLFTKKQTNISVSNVNICYSYYLINYNHEPCIKDASPHEVTHWFLSPLEKLHAERLAVAIEIKQDMMSEEKLRNTACLYGTDLLTGRWPHPKEYSYLSSMLLLNMKVTNQKSNK